MISAREVSKVSQDRRGRLHSSQNYGTLLFNANSPSIILQTGFHEVLLSQDSSTVFGIGAKSIVVLADGVSAE